MAAVNDDKGVSGRDGDYFIIQADAPVTVYLSSKCTSLHDWGVADTKNAMGQSFYVFASPSEFPNDYAGDPDGRRMDTDIEIFAYEDDTYLTISHISSYDESVDGGCTDPNGCICESESACVTNIADVDLSNREVLTFPRGGPAQTDHIELDAGQSLNLWNRTIAELGPTLMDQGIRLLAEGESYYIEATRPVTMMQGTLQRRQEVTPYRRARDGGGIIPSSNGTSSGDLFYFTIPSGHDGTPHLNERELRVQSFYDDTEICLQGWDSATQLSEEIPFDGRSAAAPCVTAAASQRLDLVGAGTGGFAALTGHDLFRLSATPGKKIYAVEQNWMETGNPGTSDLGSFVSPRNVSDETADNVLFLAYMAPPGDASAVTGVAGVYSHVFVFVADDNTEVTIRPVDVTTMPADCQDEFPDDGNTLDASSST